MTRPSEAVVKFRAKPDSLSWDEYRAVIAELDALQGEVERLRRQVLDATAAGWIRRDLKGIKEVT